MTDKEENEREDKGSDQTENTPEIHDPFNFDIAAHEKEKSRQQSEEQTHAETELNFILNP